MNAFFLETAWLIPWYGVIGAILTLPWAAGVIRQTGPRPAAYLNLLMTLMAFGHSLWWLLTIWDLPPQEIVTPWLSLQDVQISVNLEVSRISVGGAVIVTGLSLLAQLYALGYMEKDWALARFYALMGFFEGALSGILLSGSLVLSYALLEMLTLSTYLLVGFWYAQPLVITAARDAFLTKRVGDLFLLMGVVAVATLSGDLSFSGIDAWAQTAQLPPVTATLLGLAFLAGPLGKCAQFPLHVWLDEAMEGPNPASILRNSVVVGCGAYVLIKLQPILTLSPVAQDTLIALGSITAVGASLVALAQVDIKRTFSYTTSAYLGLVFITVGIQHPEAALELLFTHGLAKALLFMGIGSIISTAITQNITELGGLRSRMPATTGAFVVGSLSLLALVPLGGFWVDLRLWEVFQSTQPWLLAILLFVNGLMAFNMTRVFGLVFEGSPHIKTRRAPEVPWPMAVPMVVLIVLNLMVPWLLKLWGLIPEWTSDHQRAALLLIGSSLTGVIPGLAYFNPKMSKVDQWIWPSLQHLLAYDFYVDRLYRLCVVNPFTWGAQLFYQIDRQVVDGLVNGVSLAFIIGAEGLKYTLFGRIQLYLLTVLTGIVLIIAVALYPS
jgi:NAD(P)H-quinone oxidoreductase subunit 5